VDHFHEQVIGRRKVGDQARAIQYNRAFKAYLQERKSPYDGEHEVGSRKVTETSLNGFTSAQIVKLTQIPWPFSEDP
jgi:type I restriction enzyme, R subunit